MLHEIKIKNDTDVHENLHKFFALDDGNEDKLSIEKIKQTIEEFATNTTLRKNANKYYKEFINNNK